MKNFYKIENGLAVKGSGISIPDGFVEYDQSDKPQDLINAEEKDNSQRIIELKMLLRDSDFKAMTDYDQDNVEILEQRQLWREEIRQLEDK